MKPQAAPVILSVHTQPTPRDPAELYLDLMKKVLTRALIAKGMERHTISPHGPKSWLLYRFNHLAARFGLEAVRLTASSAEDYLESGNAARNRNYKSNCKLFKVQMPHSKPCIEKLWLLIIVTMSGIFAFRCHWLIK